MKVMGWSGGEGEGEGEGDCRCKLVSTLEVGCSSWPGSKKDCQCRWLKNDNSSWLCFWALWGKAEWGGDC